MKSKSEIMPFDDTVIEVNQQPEVVERAYKVNHASVVELAELFAKDDLSHLHILGSGDSMFAGQCVQQAFIHCAGISPSVTQAYEYAVLGDPRVKSGTAAFVISSSGRVSTTRGALDRALNSGALVVGVTDQPKYDNPFYTQPPYVLVPGGSKLGWPTQTTTATIMILLDLAIQLGLANHHLSKDEACILADKLVEIPTLMSKVLNDSSVFMNQIAQKFVDTKTFYLIGSGQGYGVANIGSALLAEGPQRIGVPLYVEEFHHSLRIDSLDLEMPVIIIASKDPAYQRYLDTVNSVNERDGYTIAIVEEGDLSIATASHTYITIPSVPNMMNTLLTVLPLHQLSLELTRYRLNSGYQRPCYDSETN